MLITLFIILNLKRKKRFYWLIQKQLLQQLAGFSLKKFFLKGEFISFCSFLFSLSVTIGIANLINKAFTKALNMLWIFSPVLALDSK